MEVDGIDVGQMEQKFAEAVVQEIHRLRMIQNFEVATGDAAHNGLQMDEIMPRVRKVFDEADWPDVLGRCFDARSMFNAKEVKDQKVGVQNANKILKATDEMMIHDVEVRFDDPKSFVASARIDIFKQLKIMGVPVEIGHGLGPLIDAQPRLRDALQRVLNNFRRS